MKRPRFSIASLLGLVLFLAISLAALRESTDLWDSAVFTTTFGLLLVSVLLAVHCKEHKRAFWLGFALFGCVALVASLVSQVESRLLTTKLLAYLGSKMEGRRGNLHIRLVRHWDSWSYVAANSQANQKFARSDFLSPERVVTGTGEGLVRIWDAATGKPLAAASDTTQNLVRIGHSLIALLLAFLGGHVSRFLCGRSHHADSGDNSGAAAAPDR
jgi:hypothetical protein